MEVVKIAYLTKNEFKELGFDDVEDFEKLEARAAMAIDLYTKNFYDFTDFETDFARSLLRKQSHSKSLISNLVAL